VLSKIGTRGALRAVRYDQKTWGILRRKRDRAVTILYALGGLSLDALVTGSTARGDVTGNSDVDIALPLKLPSYRVELALERAGLPALKRLVVQATPMSTPRAYIYLDPADLGVLSFPLAQETRSEQEFQRFGGCVRLHQLARGERVSGVNKSLMLIEPTAEGHVESSILGREPDVAKLLGVSVETVNERVRVLTRRDKVGRTGPVLRRELSREESFEAVISELSGRNPMLREVLAERG